MSPRGDAHPKSRSAWGAAVPEIETGIDWGPMRVVSEELVDADRYEPQRDGEVRVYLVAWRDGQKIIPGPAPDVPKRLGLFATADGSWAIERQITADQEDLEHALSRPLDRLTAVPEGSARRWSEIIEETHQ